MLRPNKKNEGVPVPQSVYVDQVYISGSALQSGVVVVGFRPPKSVRLDQISLFIDKLDSGTITVKTVLNKESVGSVPVVEGGNPLPGTVTLKALDRLDVVFMANEETSVQGIYFSYVVTADA